MIDKPLSKLFAMTACFTLLSACGPPGTGVGGSDAGSDMAAGADSEVGPDDSGGVEIGPGDSGRPGTSDGSASPDLPPDAPPDVATTEGPDVGTDTITLPSTGVPGLTACDPTVFGLSAPAKVYGTAVVARQSDGPEPADDVVLIWTDKFPGSSENSTDPGATTHWVRFHGPDDARTCTPTNETELGEVGLPPQREGATMSSFILERPEPALVNWSLEGNLERFELGADGALDVPSSASVDLTSEPAGADMGGFVDESNGAARLFIGNLCYIGVDCAADFGAVMAVDAVTGRLLDRLELNAWGTGTNGVRNDFSCDHPDCEVGGNDILMLQGTCESQCFSDSNEGECAVSGSYNPLNDCEMISLSFDPDSGELRLEDRLDDGNAVCHQDSGGDGVGNCVAEPTPFFENPGEGEARVVGLRTHGEVELATLTETGQLTRDCRIVWADGANRFTIPPEHAPILGEYPWSGEQVLLFGLNFRGLRGTSSAPGAYVVAIESPASFCDAICAMPGCTVELDPADYAVAQFEGGSPVWGPGAAGLYVDESDGDQALAFAIATNAATAQRPTSEPSGPGDAIRTCSGTDVPPALHLLARQQGSASWTEQVIPLGERCYEYTLNPLGGSSAWEPIQVIGGTAIVGDAVYVATTDGVFWEYRTAADEADSWALDGYLGAWPRFKRDNRGTGRAY